MIRRLTAGTLALLVQLGVFSAPLAHVHPDDHDTPHHQGGALHAHLDGHGPLSPSGSGQQLDHDDTERTVAAQLFVAVAADPIDACPPPSPLFTLVVPPEIAVGRARHVTHGHDPPATTVVGPRAPPAFLS